MYVCILLHKKCLCPTLLTSASFPERRIKGCVHRQTLCSLKCSRAATDLQILTFKPSGGKSKQQEGEIEMGKGGVKKRAQAWAERWMEGKMSSGGCCQISEAVNLFWLNTCAPSGVFIDVNEEVHRDKGWSSMGNPSILWEPQVFLCLHLSGGRSTL